MRAAYGPEIGKLWDFRVRTMGANGCPTDGGVFRCISCVVDANAQEDEAMRSLERSLLAGVPGADARPTQRLCKDSSSFYILAFPFQCLSVCGNLQHNWMIFPFKLCYS